MRDVVLRVGIAHAHETEAAVEALQVRLRADAYALPGPGRHAARHAFGHQAAAKAAADEEANKTALAQAEKEAAEAAAKVAALKSKLSG